MYGMRGLRNGMRKTLHYHDAERRRIPFPKDQQTNMHCLWQMFNDMPGIFGLSRKDSNRSICRCFKGNRRNMEQFIRMSVFLFPEVDKIANYLRNRRI